MMPGGEVLSTTAHYAPFVGARSLSITKTIDYEDGGIDINDPSEGLLFQRWRARLFRAGTVDSRVMLGAPTVTEFEVFAVPGITEISFTFDQAMNPTIAFVQDDVAKIWWYDSTISGMATTEIGEGVLTPRVSYDDKRLAASQGYLISDVILAYINVDGELCVRQQRDRYDTEYVLASDVAPLVKIGMNRGMRLQFMHEAY